MDMEKVTIRLDEDWHGNSTETIWVKPWFKKGSYQIRNIPFYSKEISLDDIIEVEELEGIKYLKHIVRKSGHSTYRFFLNENVEKDIFKDYWTPLEEIGCSYEKISNRFYTIDVPSETNIYEAYSLLEDGERNGIWEFEEGNVGHSLK